MSLVEVKSKVPYANHCSSLVSCCYWVVTHPHCGDIALCKASNTQQILLFIEEGAVYETNKNHHTRDVSH